MNNEPLVSAAARKSVIALASAKGRREAGAFLAEGTRCVVDSLPHFGLRALYCTAEWADSHPAEAADRAIVVSRREIERMSQQQSPQPVLAVFDLPAPRPYAYDGNLALALDAVQDPGNLGTIIRIADWFGIDHIIAGPATADAFAPKVVQATMGALARVSIHRCDSLARVLEASGAPVVGTFLDGRDLYAEPPKLSPRPIIVMGNEGNGISPEVARVVTERVRIPSFPRGEESVESLNVAMATAIIVSDFSRRIYG